MSQDRLYHRNSALLPVAVSRIVIAIGVLLIPVTLILGIASL